MLVNAGAVFSSANQGAPQPGGPARRILGMAFKAESDDPRESLSYKLGASRVRGGESLPDVSFSDPTFLTLEEVLAARPFVSGAARRYRDLERPPKALRRLWNIYGMCVSFAEGLVTGRRLHAGYLSRAPAHGHNRRLDNLRSTAGRAAFDRPGLPAVVGDARRFAGARARACCYHFVAARRSSALSLFHDLAYDLLAENERSRRGLRRRDRGHRPHASQITWLLLVVC